MDFIIIEDPLKLDEAVSDTQRKAVNDWFDGTLYSRLNSKRDGSHESALRNRESGIPFPVFFPVNGNSQPEKSSRGTG